ncbi:hypothetical protein [Brasilonema sp. UFV-L1]|nr:hypothetical protein [Brasilonema sp. UFV-L1]
MMNDKGEPQVFGTLAGFMIKVNITVAMTKGEPCAPSKIVITHFSPNP